MDLSVTPPRTRGGVLKARVYDALRQRITSGTYAPDERLPGEYELAASFEVSRPVVREALDELRNEGLLYSRRGAGSFVRPGRHAPGENDLSFAPVETIADIQRCYEFRLTIEPEAARFAASRRSDEALASIEQALASLRNATHQHRHREDADFAFHVAVARAANNHYHVSALLALKDHIAVGMKLHGQSLLGPRPGLQHVYAEHAGIFEAIESRDSETAAQRMRDHLSGSLKRLFEGRLLDLSL